MKKAAKAGQFKHSPFSGTVHEEVSSGILVLNSRGEFLHPKRF